MTQSQNISLFHCLQCGHVCDQLPESMPPFCCGQKMVKVGEQTVVLAEEFGNERESPIPGNGIHQ